MDKTCILIVDDNPEIREIINVLLGGEGFEVSEAGNGEQALTLIEQQDFDEAKQYIGTAIEHIDRSYKRINTGFLPIDALVSNALNIAGANNITFKSDIKIEKERINIERYDLCVALGNLLDNSIAACRTLPKDKRYISLKFARTNPATLALQIQNPYYGSIKIKKNIFYSTKHEGAGQGLYSAQLIAEKYHGIMNVNHENQIFEVKILLNLQTKFTL